MVIIDRVFLDEREVREVLSYVLPSHHVLCGVKMVVLWEKALSLGKEVKS